MEQGFTEHGVAVAIADESCRYALVERAGRPVLHQIWNHGEETLLRPISIYNFGRMACSALRTGFSWSELLAVLPDPATAEADELRAKLLADRERTHDFVEEEIRREGISEEEHDEIVEIFVRLYPAFGHFLDSWSFLSDNFYSFDPNWSYESLQSAADFRTMVQEGFGFYRKDLARAVAKSYGSALMVSARLRDVLTPEQLIELLQLLQDCKHSGWGYTATNFEQALAQSDQLARLSPALRLRLIRDLCLRLRDEEDGFALTALIEDSLLMLEHIPDSELRRFRSDRNWTELHSRVIGLASDEKLQLTDPIRFPQPILELDGSKALEPLKLRLLRTPLDFANAGSMLDNCMGKAGYYTKSYSGDSYCLVGERSGELELAMELSYRDDRWRLLQLNGKANRALENRQELEALLLKELNGESTPSRARAQQQPALL